MQLARPLVLATFAIVSSVSGAQTPSPAPRAFLLRPARVFDGVRGEVHVGWVVLVRGDRIEAAGPSSSVPASLDVQTIDLPGMTLMPGMIEAHSHLLLHPYNETSWDDQVLREPLGLRTARAVVHARATLLAGFTTVRDLGTEGAGTADVGIRMAIDQGIIPGPRVLATNRAIVATGSYGPSGFAPEVRVPQGAEEASGTDELTRVVRRQIADGADWIKVYADYRWGPGGEARPTFTEAELRTIVEVAGSSGRHVVAHASTAEGMRRSVLAGVRTIEHGDAGTPAVWRLMAERGVALCPTLAAGHAIAQYRGWVVGRDPEPARIAAKRASFRAAVAAGVTICNGSDVGVFAHGDNVRELELMVEYGFTAAQALLAATGVTARALDIDGQVGAIRTGLMADIIAVEGSPLSDVKALRRVRFVMKGGTVYLTP